MDCDAELLDAFIASCHEQLGDIEGRVLSLEDGGASGEHVGAIFRAAHSIKADAAAMGFDFISDFAHAVEDVLDLVRKGRLPVSRDLTDALLHAFDCLRRMIDAPQDCAARNPVPSLMRLNRVLCQTLEVQGHRGVADGVAVADVPDAAVCGAGGSGGMDSPVEDVDERIRHLSIPAARLDTLVDQVGELAVMQTRLQQWAGRDRELAGMGEDLGRLLDGLREQVMRLRLVPLKPVFAKFRRLVRDVAATTGKQVEFVATGEDTVLDKSAVERIQGPLAHLVRNAVDHGIEPELERMGLGKEPEGRVWLEARQVGGEVEIEVRDDGRGIDHAALLRRARERGLENACLLGEDTPLTELACLPGLSTAEAVSAYSGRGVGMDAVRQGVTELRGTLALESQPGRGTVVCIRLPLSLAILECLEVVVGQSVLFLPLSGVVECLELRRSRTILHDGRTTLPVRGIMLPVACLGQVLELPSGSGDIAAVVVALAGAERFGLIVDRIAGHRQIVLKPLARSLGRLEGIAGCTVAEDGGMALVLDLAALARLCLGTHSVSHREQPVVAARNPQL